MFTKFFWTQKAVSNSFKENYGLRYWIIAKDPFSLKSPLINVSILQSEKLKFMGLNLLKSCLN